jgi:hypothetical protein
LETKLHSMVGVVERAVNAMERQVQVLDSTASRDVATSEAAHDALEQAHSVAQRLSEMLLSQQDSVSRAQEAASQLLLAQGVATSAQRELALSVRSARDEQLDTVEALGHYVDVLTEDVLRLHSAAARERKVTAAADSALRFHAVFGIITALCARIVPRASGHWAWLLATGPVLGYLVERLWLRSAATALASSVHASDVVSETLRRLPATTGIEVNNGAVERVRCFFVILTVIHFFVAAAVRQSPEVLERRRMQEEARRAFTAAFRDVFASYVGDGVEPTPSHRNAILEQWQNAADPDVVVQEHKFTPGTTGGVRKTR